MFQGTWPVWGSAGPPSGGAWLSLAKNGLFWPVPDVGNIFRQR